MCRKALALATLTASTDGRNFAHHFWGTTLAGESSKALERYAHTLRHEPDGEMMVVDTQVSKKARVEESCIIFTKQDAQHVHFPHSDQLVVEMQIANMIAKRVLMDTGSSVNILYMSLLERMRLSSKDLEPCNQTIYEFSGEGMTPNGMIKLPITPGITPLSKTMLAKFIAVDCPSAYNVVMDRPILVELRAVVSIHHLTMKFPTTKGIGSLHEDQRTEQECYNSSISKAKRTRVVNLAARGERSDGK